MASERIMKRLPFHCFEPGYFRLVAHTKENEYKVAESSCLAGSGRFRSIHILGVSLSRIPARPLQLIWRRVRGRTRETRSHKHTRQSIFRCSIPLTLPSLIKLQCFSISFFSSKNCKKVATFTTFQ